MKKMLLLLASLSCFGLLASCSDGTQDVNLVNSSARYFWVGTVTGTITVRNDSSTTATFPIGNIATVEYTKDPNTNKIEYVLNVKYKENESENLNDATITITKIGNNYYSDDYRNVKVEGSFENSEFTITSTSLINDNKNQNLLFQDLKFTRS